MIRGGRIASVAPGTPHPPGLTAIDLRGMTAMPGYIDAHRHVNTATPRNGSRAIGSDAGVARRGLHDVLSGGGPCRGQHQLQATASSRASSGARASSPRVASILPRASTEQVRAETRRLAALGVEIMANGADADAGAEKELRLARVVDEARKDGVHVHGPRRQPAGDDGGRRRRREEARAHAALRLAHVRGGEARRGSRHQELSTIGFGVPVFGVFNRRQRPRFATAARGRSRFSARARTRPARRPSTRARSGTTASSTASAPTRTTCRSTGSITS